MTTSRGIELRIIRLYTALTAAVVVCLAAYAVRARQQSDPRALLQLMRQANLTQDYEASANAEFWFGNRKRTSTVQIHHQHPNRRLLVLGDTFSSGSDGAREWMYDAKKKRASWCFPADNDKLWNKDLDLLLSNYSTRTVGHRVIAGRDGVALDIVSRYPARPRIKMVVDAATGVALAQEEFDCYGRPVSRTVLKKINYSPQLEGVSFDPPVTPPEDKSALVPMSRREVAAEMGFDPGVPARLPIGFRLDSFSVYRCTHSGDCQLKAALISLTDGLDHLSVYESRPPHLGCSDGQGKGKGKGCDLDRFAHGTVVHVDRNGTRIAVVGSLAEAELRRVAESIPTR